MMGTQTLSTFFMSSLSYRLCENMKNSLVWYEIIRLPAYNNVNLIAKQNNIAYCITGTYLYYGNYYGLIISIVSKESSYTIHSLFS